MRGSLAQQKAAAAKKLGERSRAKGAQPLRHSIVGERPQLLGHREAPFAKTTLGRSHLHVQGIGEVGASEWNGEREAEPRPVELVDRDDGEGSRRGLLRPSGRVWIGPDDVPLAEGVTQ